MNRHKTNMSEKQPPPQVMTPMERIKFRDTLTKAKRLLAASAIYMTFVSGGALDRIGDELTQAEDVVASAIGEPTLQQLGPDHELDGIAFKDFPQSAQKEMQREAEADFAQEQRSFRALTELFGAIDDNGIEVAMTLAEQYRTDHADEFINPEVALYAREALDRADDTGKVFEALDSFMAEYGVDAMSAPAFHGTNEALTVDVASAKEVAKAYINVFGELPKTLIKDAQLKTVTISSTNELSDGGEALGQEAGMYSLNDNRINIPVVSSAMKLAYQAEGVLVGTDFTYEASIAHELGHAISHNLPVGTRLPEGEVIEDDNIGGPVLSQMTRNLIDKPEVPSAYSRTDSEEYTAELLSGLLSGRKDGLATPDQWRQFSSESNKAMLNVLDQLERQYPGVASLLIANRFSDQKLSLG